MASVNKAILVGNLGADPDIRHTQAGTAVANLSVATSENWTDKSSGEKRERTEWHRVVLWDRLAEIAEQYLKKGDKVYLEGQLQTRKWQDNAGVEKYTTEVVLQGFNSKLVMLSSRDSTERPKTSRGAHDKAQAPLEETLDDEIPF